MRKKDRKCIDENENDIEEVICKCREYDWECDFGFVKKKNEEICVPISEKYIIIYKHPIQSFNTTHKSYRPANCAHG